MAAFTQGGIELEAVGIALYLNNLKRADKGQQRLGKSAIVLSKQSSGLGKVIGGVGAIAGGVVLAGVAALGAGVVALGVGLVASTKVAISFESAFAGVIKTVPGLTDEMGQLTGAGEGLREGFVDLSKEVPLAFEELAAIGEIGGQLGIAEADLLGFTETVTALGVATNLTTEEAGVGLARFSSIFSQTISDAGQTVSQNIGSMGSALVNLGNNLATNEAKILSFAERLAASGQIAGISQAGVLGISAAFSAVGIEAQAGGTAVSTALQEITKAVGGAETGFVDNTKAIDANIKKLTSLNANLVRAESATGLTGAAMVGMREEFIAAGGSAEDFGRQLGDTNRQKLLETQLAVNSLTKETQLLRDTQGQPVRTGALEEFARVAGMSADEFAEAWRTDADQAFQSFVEGLANEGEQGAATLEKLGLGGSQATRAFLSLAGAGDTLERALDLANEGVEDGNFAMREAAQRYATTESQLLILKNTIRAAGDAIGSQFLPFLNQLIGVGKNMIDRFAGPAAKAIENFIKKIKDLVTTFQAGGLFGSRSGSFGSEGLLAALGIPPNVIGIIQTIFDGITAVFADFQEGGFLAGFQSLGQRFWDWLTVVAIPQLPGILTQVWTRLSALLLEGWESKIQPMLLEQGQRFWDFLTTTVIPAIPEKLLGVWTTLSTLLTEGWENNIRPILEVQGGRFWDFLTTVVIPAIPGVLTEVITGITSFLSEQFPTIQTTLAEWADRFWEWTAIAVSTAQKFLGLILVSIKEWALSGETQTQLSDMGVALGETIATGIQLLFENQEKIAAVMIKLGAGLLVGVGAVAGLLIIIGGQIVAGILEGIVNSITDGNLEATTFSELGAVLGGIATNALIAAKIIGTNVMLGVSQGILDGIADLTTTLNQIGEIIVTVVSDFLGISSPSTVFFDFGIDIIQGLIDGILSLAGSLPDILSGLFGDLLGEGGISGLLGGLFGGGDAVEGPDLGALDLSSLTESLADILPAIQEVQTALGLITTETLPALTAAMIATAAAFSSSLLQILAQVLQVDIAIQAVYLVTLPTLLSATIVTATAMIAAFLSIIPSVNQLTAVITVLAATIVTAKNAAVTMADALVSGFNDATGAAEDLAKAIEEVTEEMKKLGDASSQLTSAAGTTASVAAGIGFSGGIGLKHGLGLQDGLGVVIPPGFPNDSFGPLFVESGERMLIIPRGGPTVEELVARRGGVAGGSVVTVTNIFDITVNNAMDEEILIRRIQRTAGGIG